MLSSLLFTSMIWQHAIRGFPLSRFAMDVWSTLPSLSLSYEFFAIIWKCSHLNSISVQFTPIEFVSSIIFLNQIRVGKKSREKTKNNKMCAESVFLFHLHFIYLNDFRFAKQFKLNPYILTAFIYISSHFNIGLGFFIGSRISNFIFGCFFSFVFFIFCMFSSLLRVVWII